MNQKKSGGSSNAGGAYYGSSGGSLPLRSMSSLAGETILAFFNWSLVVEYISIIWFYPMGFMGFTGMEAFLVMMFTPILLFGFVRHFLGGKTGVLVRMAALLVALAALYPYDINDPKSVEKHELILWKNPHVTKTVFVGIGLALDWLCQCRAFIANAGSNQRRERVAFSYMMAIVFHALIRLPYLSVNPFMTWKNWIVFGAALVVFAAVVLLRESTEESERRRPVMEDASSPLTTGIGFGGVLFMSQLFLSTYGVIPRWLNLGPYPAGILVIVAMIAGVVISKKTSMLTSRNTLIFMVVVGALYGFCSGTVPTAVGLFGLVLGCILVSYTMALWNVIIEKMSNTQRPVSMFIYAFITYTILLFWAIYVVSYKFVPWYLGSTLLRERHQTMVIAGILAMGAGALNFDSERGPSSPKKDSRHSSIVSYPPREVFYGMFVGLVLLLLFSVNRNLSHPTQAAVAGNHYERIVTPTSVENIPPTEIKSMIWTIHFGYDNYGRNSFPNITDAIRSHGANVIGLLESDLSRIMTSNRDLVEWLASELHMHSDFGPAPSQNTWGCALLSIFPIESSKHVILPSPEGELACLIDAIIRVDGVAVNVIVTHFGNTEDKLDRKLQAEGAAAIVSSNNNMPTVFLSYITEKTGGDNYKTLLAAGLEDTTTLKRYCEYVFYRGLEMTKFERWSCGEISDTEGQLTNFKIKKSASGDATN
ncbi:putative transmembrane protein [Heterostelium album PN500]|uniref:Putative transmembrane protein n=1 Tax=Heterostelium pallidum (strain ATCC 26659 / Pp 5 / PN500) TaxID=670386 RepID=D3AXW1_HETP5|nr:putative transmembrane protein [Heterostelium album PN500]EFA85788.1 putative transmembrane protein [Heterostelium album PN500]|eukprot:XP_020437894.1 putative transmembrane protein [Heterostelium album PN500]